MLYGRGRVSPDSIVILNLFQDNRRPLCIILKQVQDDDKIDDDKITAALPDKRATAA